VRRRAARCRRNVRQGRIHHNVAPGSFPDAGYGPASGRAPPSASAARRVWAASAGFFVNGILGTRDAVDFSEFKAADPPAATRRRRGAAAAPRRASRIVGAARALAVLACALPALLVQAQGLQGGAAPARLQPAAAPWAAIASAPGQCGAPEGGAGPGPASPAPADPPLRLRSERLLGGGRAGGRAVGGAGAAGPVYARADEIGGELDIDTVMQGHVELRRAGLVLRADHAVYTFAEDRVDAEGHVHLAQRGTVFEGPSLDLKLEAQSGRMPQASYRYPARNGRGDAELVEFLSQDEIRLHRATYTTCDPSEPAWWVRAERMDIHEADQEAEGHQTTMYFEGLPIFYWPLEFDFPLGYERRSGLLTPGFGQSSMSGPVLSFPYYWNIAPNRDFTITPMVMTQRGVALDNEFRFLEPNARGLIDYDVLEHDRTTGTKRDHIALQSNFDDAHGLKAYVNFNRVSDDGYFTEFATTSAVSSQEVLPQEAGLSYTQPYWNASLILAKSQTLISLLAQTDSGPYEKVPELRFQYNHKDWHGFDIGGLVDATRFQHPAVNPCFAPPEAVTAAPTALVPCPQPTSETEPYSQAWFAQDGSRLVLNPSLSYPILAPGWFFVPKAQWHYTTYALDPNYNNGATSASRSLPIGSIDSGLIFERSTTWLGSAAHQTLEPRLFYALVPYRNQDQLPNFDSADADFNFAQLFTENTFTGSDRIAQANEITAAVTTRMIDDETGAERLRVAFGQRFYFGPQQVTLPGDVPRTDKASDTLLLASASLGRKWMLDMGVDYSGQTRQLALGTIGFRWQPRAASVLNVGYRFEIANLAGTSSNINQPNISFQWPVSQHWYSVGAVDYSISDRALAQSVIGAEYKSDCWVMRIALSRYAVTLPNSQEITNNYTTNYFIQFEFNGLASAGFNPLGTLQGNIPGYQRINPPPAPPGAYDHYE
jgi:LPS-assembly protein